MFNLVIIVALAFIRLYQWFFMYANSISRYRVNKSINAFSGCALDALFNFGSFIFKIMNWLIPLPKL